MKTKAAVLVLGALLCGGTALWAFTAVEPHRNASSEVSRQVAQSWQELSPRERSRALENYKRFQKLSPERRQNLEERYHRWTELPDEEKDRVRRNYDRFRKMDSDEKEEFWRKYKRWQAPPR
jgi:hypothetical protein